MGGRPRTPTAELEARGAFIKHPERKRARAAEPVPTGKLGSAPKYFTALEKKLWKELNKLLPEGVAMNLDRWHVETACVLMAKQRGRTITTPERGQLIKCLIEMGMTPVSRSKVAVKPQKPEEDDDPYAEFEVQ